MPVFGAALTISICLICPAQEVEFKRDIAPILENRCWDCHNAEAHEGELKLDTLRGMLKGGSSGIAAILPGKPEQSYLIDVVSHLDPNLKMPPEQDRIPAKEIELLKQWIKEGATWPGQQGIAAGIQSDHWSFQPVVRSEIPKTKTGNNPIDAFLLASLKSQGLGYSKPAEATALLRRASIVLTGLMPTPKENNAFLASWKQDSEKAYTDLIDRLMSSPHFGERWAHTG